MTKAIGREKLWAKATRSPCRTNAEDEAWAATAKMLQPNADNFPSSPPDGECAYAQTIEYAMKINASAAKPVRFEGEDDSYLDAYYDNRGEPYRAGLTVEIGYSSGNSINAFIEGDELIRLRDYLNAITGLKPATISQQEG